MTGKILMATGQSLANSSGASRMGVDTSNHLWVQQMGGGTVWMPGLQTSLTSDQVIPMQDGTPATQSLTVLPAMFTPGATIRCSCEGIFTGELVSAGLLFGLGFVSPTITTNMQWQGNNTSGISTNTPFKAQCLCTVRTIGTSATAIGGAALWSQGIAGIVQQVAEADRDNSLGVTFNSTTTTSLRFSINGGIHRGFTISSIIIEMLLP